ncbi:MAG: HXXEE domain-containing protein [Bacteroidota bacterium]
MKKLTKGEKLLLGSILLLFSMLWLPLGQYDFLIDHWMKIGVYATVFLLIGSFSFWKDSQPPTVTPNFRVMALLMLVAYIIHQFEEHWIDLYGNYYAFYGYNNNFIRSVLGETDTSINPLSKASVFVINTSLVWLLGFLSIWRSPKHLFPLFAMAGIILINGLVHILAGLINWEYNPGLFTSVVVFIPIYFWTVRRMRNHIGNYKAHIFYGLVWALLAHVIMVGGLLLANWYKVIPEYFYWISLVLWTIVPVTILKKSHFN